MTDPATRTYSETWPGRGVPMDELAAFVARAVDAGAPLTARIRLENADRNVLLGMTVPGTRLSVAWAYGQSTKPNPSTPDDGADDETELACAQEEASYRQEGVRNRQEARNRQERAKGGIVDRARNLALVGEPPTAHEPWRPFKPGDVLQGHEPNVVHWLGTASEGSIVVDAAGEEWTNDGALQPAELSTWIRGRDRTSPAFADRIAPHQLALHAPLTIVSVGEAQSPAAEPWPFKPGDVVDDVEGAVTEWLDAAPVGTVVVDAADDEWKHEGLSSWVGTHRTDSAGLAARGPLTVVRVGDR